MAILWILEWDGIDKATYADLKASIDFEGEAPKGLHHQVTAFGDKSLVLTQIWQSPDHVMRFMEDRMLPAIGALGIRSMPKVDQYVIDSVFLPPAS